MSRRNADPDPLCDHGPMINRVTSLPDDVEWKSGMPLRAVWVCGQRACVIDAMAWVERGTGQRAIVYGPFSGTESVKAS